MREQSAFTLTSTLTTLTLHSHSLMLDFTQVFTQIQTFASERADALPRLEAALREARRRLDASGPTWEDTRGKIGASKTSWLVASWHEPPDAAYAPLPAPSPCTVFAADGSQIVSDRHDIALCYLLNIGLIACATARANAPRSQAAPTLPCPKTTCWTNFRANRPPSFPNASPSAACWLKWRGWWS